VGPRAGLDDVERRENSRPYRYSNSDPSVFQLTPSRHSDCAVLHVNRFGEFAKSRGLCNCVERFLITGMSCVMHLPRVGEVRHAYKILAGKLEGKSLE
jgi:hypothetical protein